MHIISYYNVVIGIHGFTLHGRGSNTGLKRSVILARLDSGML